MLNWREFLLLRDVAEHEQRPRKDLGVDRPAASSISPLPQPPLPEPPRRAVPALVVTVVIGFTGFVAQAVFLFLNQKADHKVHEQAFWLVTNLELLAPAVISAILAWLTFTLIKYTVEALNLARRQAFDEALSAKRNFEPMLDIDLFTASVKAMVRACFRKTDLNEVGNKETWQISQKYDPSDKELSLAAQLEIDQYILVDEVEFSCVLRNVGRGAAHSINVSVDGFIWEEYSTNDYADAPYYRRMVKESNFEQAVDYISLDLSRSLAIMPSKRKQKITAVGRIEFQGENYRSMPQINQVGAFVNVRYKAFGDDDFRALTICIFTKQDLSKPGVPSTIKVVDAETHSVANPVLGLVQPPLIPFKYIPLFDLEGQRLVLSVLTEIFSTYIESVGADVDGKIQISDWLRWSFSSRLSEIVLAVQNVQSESYGLGASYHDVLGHIEYALNDDLFQLWVVNLYNKLLQENLEARTTK